MLRIASVPVRVKTRRRPEPITLTDTPKLVPISEARRLVRAADYVALSIPMGGLRQELFDISKRMAYRFLNRAARRFTSVPAADLFGTLVLGDEA